MTAKISLPVLSILHKLPFTENKNAIYHHFILSFHFAFLLKVQLKREVTDNNFHSFPYTPVNNDADVIYGTKQGWTGDRAQNA